MSGFPGNADLWVVNRQPRLLKTERTSRSGVVFLPLIADMQALRWDGLSVSDTD